MTRSMLQADRVAGVLKHVRALSSASGEWRKLTKGTEEVNVWAIDSDAGWQALIELEGTSDADRIGSTDPLSDIGQSFTLDVWLKDDIKVVSLRWVGATGTAKLISMRPGPWELISDYLTENGEPPMSKS